MKKTILLVLSFCFLAACSDDSNNNPSPPPNSPRKVYDQDISTCNGPDERSIQGAWTVSESENGIGFHTTFYFDHGTFYITTTCEFSELGFDLTARTNTNYYDSGRYIRFTRDNSQTERYNDGSTKADCTASIQAMTIDYRLQGKCLILTKNSESYVLRRTRY